MEEGWGEGGQFIESCSCVHWAFFTSLLPRTANYTNPIRRGNGLFGNYFWKRERKTTHKCKFSDCHLQPLNIQPSTSSCCWRHAWHSSVSPGWAAVRNQGVIFFFFQRYVFFNIKKFCDENLYCETAMWSGMRSASAETQASLGSSSWCDDLKNVARVCFPALLFL